MKYKTLKVYDDYKKRNFYELTKLIGSIRYKLTNEEFNFLFGRLFEYNKQNSTNADFFINKKGSIFTIGGSKDNYTLMLTILRK